MPAPFKTRAHIAALTALLPVIALSGGAVAETEKPSVPTNTHEEPEEVLGQEWESVVLSDDVVRSDLPMAEQTCGDAGSSPAECGETGN
ncbi:hypothetical protein ACN2XU_07490 [Primorskyibacter sp. 2E107]|uniref:hypothetical protein n=1 Tax=Primorskyibacter sp. 2E107 TaxID=3403458 RepID=UPI003AF6961F